jgi:hypothetical protein
MKDPVRFARNFCYWAGWYGILTHTPLLFMEAKFGSKQPPPVNHPELYYGYIAVALSWQVAFLMLSRDPLAHRAFLVPAGLEKLAFATAGLWLYFDGKVSSLVGAFAGVDLLFASGFFFSFFKLASLTM